MVQHNISSERDVMRPAIASGFCNEGAIGTM